MLTALSGACASGTIDVHTLRKGLPMPQSKVRRYLKHGMMPQLSVFEAVARHGNFTRAGEELCMAQPTVSVQIRKLTETLGVPLLEQIGKRVHLTPAGKVVHATAMEVFKALTDMEERLGGLRGLEAGTLRVAATTAARTLAPRLLSEFAKTHPGVQVSLQICPREQLLARIAQNADDLYIVSQPPEENEVVVQQLMTNPVVALARDDHPLAREKNIPFARFAEEPFLIREAGSGTRLIAERTFEKHDCEPKVRMELGSNEAIVEALLAGVGVSMMYRHALGRDGRHDGLVELDVVGFPVETHWHFVYPIGKQVSVVARTFMDYARAETQAWSAAIQKK